MLEKLSVRLQRRVSNIVKSVDFNSDTSDPNIMTAIQYFKQNDGSVDQHAPIEFLENNQKRIIYDANNKMRTSFLCWVDPGLDPGETQHNDKMSECWVSLRSTQPTLDVSCWFYRG